MGGIYLPTYILIDCVGSYMVVRRSFVVSFAVL